MNNGAVAVHFYCELARLEPQRVTERNQFVSAFCGHRAGDNGRLKHGPLGRVDFVAGYGRQYGSRKPDSRAGVRHSPAMAPPKLSARLVVRGVGDAITFYTDAFGAREVERYAMPDGFIVNGGVNLFSLFLMFKWHNKLYLRVCRSCHDAMERRSLFD